MNLLSSTKRRKHIDWEIQAAMCDSVKNRKMGILVINLPYIKQKIISQEEDQLLASDNSRWEDISDRVEYEKILPYMPIRIIDNLEKDVPITVVEWNRIVGKPDILKELIDNAFRRREKNVYRIHRPLKRDNGKVI